MRTGDLPSLSLSLPPSLSQPLLLPGPPFFLRSWRLEQTKIATQKEKRNSSFHGSFHYGSSCCGDDSALSRCLSQSDSPDARTNAPALTIRQTATGTPPPPFLLSQAVRRREGEGEGSGLSAGFHCTPCPGGARCHLPGLMCCAKACGRRGLGGKHMGVGVSRSRAGRGMHENTCRPGTDGMVGVR